MRFQFDSSIPNNKAKESKNVENPTLNEHTKILDSITSVRNSIEDAEKKFKNFIQLRQRLEANVGKKGLLDDPVTIDELINRAKSEFEIFKDRKKGEIVDKSKNDKAIEEQLQKKIIETKDWYQRSRSLTKAGPKFIRHSYSPFGNILCVTLILENMYAVFTSCAVGNDLLIEIWKHEGDSFIPIEAFEIPGEPMTCVNELYRQDMQQEIDYLEDVPDNKDYLVGIRSHVKPFVPKSAFIVKEVTKETEKVVKKITNIKDIPLQPPSKVRTLLTVEEINKTASIKLSSHGKLIDWDNYFLSDLPTVGYRHTYFYGTKEGTGGIFELILKVTPNMTKIYFEAQIRSQTKLSHTPIKLSHFYFLQDGCPLIVSEITNKNGGQFLQAMTLNLETEWLCKVDMLRLSAVDRCTRYANKAEINSTELSSASDTPLITAYDYDNIHGCLILGTNTGNVLRYFYQREAQVNTGAVDKTPTPAKVVWCLQVTRTAPVVPSLPNTEEVAAEEVNAMNKINKDAIKV